MIENIKKWLVLFLSSLLVSCSYDKLSVAPTCDSSSVSYSKDIKPILMSNCYSCHSTSATAGGEGLDLENFVSLSNYLKNDYRGNGIFGSQFYHVIKKSSGVIPMPPSSGRLSDCDVAKIHIWISNNAPEN